MANNNIKLDLKKKQDKDGRTYYVAKLEGPAFLDCRDGIAFLMFISDEGEEQLQIALMDKKKEYNKDE